MEQLAADKIKKTARTFEDWLNVYHSVSPSSSLGQYAFEQLPVVAKTLEDWQQIYSTHPSEITRAMALEKMATMAHSTEEQVMVYDSAPETSPVKAAMLAVLKSKNKDFREWKKLFEISSGSLEKFAAVMMIESAPNDIGEIDGLLGYDAISNDAVLEEKVLARVRTLNISLDKWVEVLNDSDTPDKIKTLALEKISKDPEMASKGLDDWTIILDDLLPRLHPTILRPLPVFWNIL
jgi:hypothetical protein